MRVIIDADGYREGEMARCKWCRFFDHQGDCRRHAPNHIVAHALGESPGLSGSYLWPIVSPDDFCGEFERGVTLAPETVEEQKEREAGA